MNKLCRWISQKAPRLPTSAKSPFDGTYKELMSIASADMKEMGWKFREILTNGIISEFELTKHMHGSQLCIKALPTQLEIDEEGIESEIAEAKSQKYLNLMDQSQGAPGGNLMSLLAEKDKEIAEEHESDREVAEIIIVPSRFVLGIRKSQTDKGLLAICSSRNGSLSIEHIMAATHKLPMPEYNNECYATRVIGSKVYKGPVFDYINSYLQILMNEYFEKFEIDEKFLTTLELLSAGYEMKRVEQGSKLFDHFKGTKIIKA